MAQSEIIRKDIIQIGWQVQKSPFPQLGDDQKKFQNEGEKGTKSLKTQFESLNKTIDKVGKAAFDAGKKVATGLGKTAVKGVKVLAKSAAAAGSAFAGLVGLSVKGYADYEQLVGGVETLFKDSKDQLVKYANDAYKTAGLSANDYMETVTSFSASLLQSVGGDTNKAAQLANQAVIDMSDNANKMGTDMESIQFAYQGFAKQNYTMLDNLKLGYGGTKTEMERLLKDAQKISGQKFDLSSYADVVQAIHVIQENMGIAGTTSKEAATTIQGSFLSMKAAASNFMTGMADPSQDFDQLVGNLIDSVVTFAKNIIPRIKATIPRLAQGLISIGKEIAPYVQPMLETIGKKIKEYAPIIGQKMKELLFTAKDWLIANKGVIWEGFKTVLAEGLNVLSGLFTGSGIDVEGIKNTIQSIADKVISFVNVIKNNWGTIKEIVISLGSALLIVVGVIKAVAAAMAIWNAVMAISPITWIVLGIVALIAIIILLVRNWDKVKEVAINCWNKIKEAFGKAGEWFKTTVVEPVKNFFVGLWNGIKSGAQAVWNGICNVFSTVTGWIYDHVISPIVKLVKGIVTVVLVVVLGIIGIICQKFAAIAGWINAHVIQPVIAWFKVLWAGIKSIVTSVKNTICTVWATISGWVNSKVIQPIKNFFISLWGKVKEIVNSVKNTIVAIWGTISGWVNSNIISPVVNLFSNLWDKIKSGVNIAKDAIVNAFQAAWDKVTGVWNGLKEFFSGIWSGLKKTGGALKDALVSIWKDAVTAVAKPVNKLIDGANWVLERLGSKKEIASWQPYARGTNGHPGGNAMVNDGRGAELVQMPNGATFIPRGRNVLLPNAPKGMKVLPAEQTAALMGRRSPTFNYADGTGFDIFDFFDDAKGLVGKVIDKFVSFGSMGGFTLDVAKGMISTAKDAMASWIKNLFGESGKSLGSYVASAGVEQWRSTVIQALKMEGLYSEANVKRTLYQMQTESGGNPRAINLWDSNAKKGIPSKGLMQVIDPTFKTYARKGYSSNIYDPLSNILASIRYAVATYGSLEKAYRGVGYAGGVGKVVLPAYAPGVAVSGSSAGNTTTNDYSPSFSLTVSGASDRTLERNVKKWVKESLDEVFNSMSRKNPRVREV